MPAVQSIQQIMTAVDESLNEFNKNPIKRPVAAFDADGTLWDTDIGEAFFKYQADNKLVDLPKDPWNYYQRWHENEPIPAYLWLAQINKGKKIDEVRSWAKAAVDKTIAEKGELPVFPYMVELIQYLKQREFEVYIVTASVKWAVEPAAELVGVDRDNVIGIETSVVDGVVTDRGKLPITWREGKRIALLEKTGGRRPLFAAGNTNGDHFLLESAVDIAFAHTTVGEDHPIYSTEVELLEAAKENDWYWWQP